MYQQCTTAIWVWENCYIKLRVMEQSGTRTFDPYMSHFFFEDCVTLSFAVSALKCIPFPSLFVNFKVAVFKRQKVTVLCSKLL